MKTTPLRCPQSCLFSYADWTSLTHPFVHTLLTHCQIILMSSTDKDAVSTYAPTLVLAMLKNCMYSEMPDPGVRAAALKYLALLPGTVRYDLLHPYKTRVLKELAKTLDDPKRAVRKEAVVARYGMVTFSVAYLFEFNRTNWSLSM
ncbi:hypothetical protein DFH29DRAFT_608857 [Suillus ampliporus]|nr:hypothetical protein DFH29DRAFT_608857 [Suillus ampliporus]